MFLRGLSYYVFDHNFGELLAMAVFAAIALATLLLEDNHFVTLYERLFNLTYNFSALYQGCAYFYLSIYVAQQHAVKLHLCAFFSVFDVLDIQIAVFLCLELLSLDLNDYVHLN